MEIKTALDLSKYKSNSLILAKVDSDWLRDSDQIGNLQRNIADLKQKVNIDDSTVFWVVGGDVDVTALDEGEMNEMGWFKKEPK